MSCWNIQGHKNVANAFIVCLVLLIICTLLSPLQLKKLRTVVKSETSDHTHLLSLIRSTEEAMILSVSAISLSLSTIWGARCLLCAWKDCCNKPRGVGAHTDTAIRTRLCPPCGSPLDSIWTLKFLSYMPTVSVLTPPPMPTVSVSPHAYCINVNPSLSPHAYCISLPPRLLYQCYPLPLPPCLLYQC